MRTGGYTYQIIKITHKGLQLLACINEADQTDDEWPHEDKEVRSRGIDGERIAPDLFKNNEAMTLYDILCWLN